MTNVMRTLYIQNVLGVNQWVKPARYNDIYTVYSSLDKDIMVLTAEEYSDSHQELLHRIMKSLNQKNYFVVYWKDPNNTEALRNLLLRSKALCCVVFGVQWVQVLNSFCSRPIEFQKILLDLNAQIQVPAVITYSFSQLKDTSDSDLKQKKLSTFSTLKGFFSCS